MKKILSIARTVLLLLFRSGAGWGMIGLTVSLAVFMFFSTASDNLLVNELHLRIKYSLYAFTILLNVALIYFSCVTLRKDIDDRRFHNIAAAPVHRAQIWLGKFVGVLSFGLIVFLAASLSIALSCSVFILNWKNADDIDSLSDNFFRTYYVCRPDLAAFEKDLEETYNIERKALEERQAKEKETGEHVHGEHCRHGHEKTVEVEPEHEHHEGCNHGELEGDIWRSRKYLLDYIRKQKLVIAHDEEKSWDFDWTPSDVQGEFVILRFKFYADTRRSKVDGVWSLAGTEWKHEFSEFPFLNHEIRIPANVVNKSKRLKLVFSSKTSTSVIFPVYNDGITLLYDSGGLFKNFTFLLLFSLLHMATLVALALTFSSLFSYSVAVFTTTATYITGAFYPFFQRVLSDLSYHDQTLINQFCEKIIELGLWFTEGTQAFSVNDMFADGISIPYIIIIKNDFISYFIYLLILASIGIIALTRKEIDKILQH